MLYNQSANCGPGEFYQRLYHLVIGKNRIHFILNLGHFLKIFETIENMKVKLVWLPTCHQAKIICKNLNISQTEINAALCGEEAERLWADVRVLYKLISRRL